MKSLDRVTRLASGKNKVKLVFKFGDTEFYLELNRNEQPKTTARKLSSLADKLDELEKL